MILSHPRAGSRTAAALGGLIAVAVALSGCTAGGSKANPTTTVATSLAGDGGLGGGAGETGAPTTPTTKKTTPAPHTSKPAVVTTGPITEVAVDVCPYIGTQDAADAEGNRIGQVLLLKRVGKTVGCRFRFQYADNHYTLEIVINTYKDATTAYNAMVRQGSAGTDYFGVTLSTGQQGVLYRTHFYDPDGARDWACVFAKGTKVVTIKTDQIDPSANARFVAEKVAPNV